MFDYEVGKQVVCIDMGPWTNFDTGKRVKFQTPIMDMVYTIRSHFPGTCSAFVSRKSGMSRRCHGMA